ncbi:MAG: hypothetical protein Q8M92_02675 [Candidatus Subteraquimicrobiales bacterium]|nr:hypothetical protein [Candidatus Subteraquimicrobiales bacterium]
MAEISLIDEYNTHHTPHLVNAEEWDEGTIKIEKDEMGWLKFSSHTGEGVLVELVTKSGSHVSYTRCDTVTLVSGGSQCIGYDEKGKSMIDIETLAIETIWIMNDGLQLHIKRIKPSVMVGSWGLVA